MIGNQKRPMGLDHWNSSRFNTFVERPFVVETMNPDARRLGLGFWGKNDEESLFWQYGVYSLENLKDDGTIKGDNIQMSTNVRLGGSPFYEDKRNWFHWAVAGMGAWQIALRYSFLDLNDGAAAPAPVWGGVGESVTLGLNWWFNKYSRIQFNLIHGQIENRLVAGTLYSGNYTIAGTRYAVDF